MNRKPLPTHIARAIGRLTQEADRVDVVLAARKDGFDRPTYTCNRDDTDTYIALVRHAYELSYNLRTED